MSLNRNQSGNRLYNKNEADDFEGENLPLHPSRISRSSTLEDMAEENMNNDLVTRGVMEPCQRPCNINSPSLANRPRVVKRNETIDVNIEMNSRDESLDSPSSGKCFGLVKNGRLSQRDSSSNSFCGPSPRKSMRWICIFVFVWITFMVVINMQKQLSALEHELDIVTGEIMSMKKNHHNLRKKLTKQNHIDSSKIKEDFPHDAVKEIKYGQKEESSKTSGGSKHGSSSNSKPSETNGVLTTTRPKVTSTSLPSDIADSEDCTTESGAKCIFPFYYDDKRLTSCRQTWRDIKPWCATRVDENDKFIDDSNAWDWCSSTCPISK